MSAQAPFSWMREQKRSALPGAQDEALVLRSANSWKPLPISVYSGMESGVEWSGILFECSSEMSGWQRATHGWKPRLSVQRVIVESRSVSFANPNFLQWFTTKLKERSFSGSCNAKSEGFISTHAYDVRYSIFDSLIPCDNLVAS